MTKKKKSVKRINGKRILKKLIISLGVINAGFGSAINNNTLIIIGTLLSIIGAWMIALLKW